MLFNFRKIFIKSKPDISQKEIQLESQLNHLALDYLKLEQQYKNSLTKIKQLEDIVEASEKIYQGRIYRDKLKSLIDSYRNVK